MAADIYEERLIEIGRITTTWAKFEHWIDQALWVLADISQERRLHNDPNRIDSRQVPRSRGLNDRG
jgi:hypothetical protein